MKAKGVLDRITDGKYATIIVEEVGKEFVLDIKRLPKGSREGDWFDLVLGDNEIESLSLNKEYTDERQKSIEQKMKRLRKRAGSKFKRE